jgi:hypothetical protein
LSPHPQAFGQGSSRYEEQANQPFEKGFPTEATARCLIDELVFQRYVQSYLWA